jgi:hypothetical protein
MVSGVTFKGIIAKLQERDAEGYRKTIAAVMGLKGKQLDAVTAAFKAGEEQMLRHLVAMGVVEVKDGG